MGGAIRDVLSLTPPPPIVGGKAQVPYLYNGVFDYRGDFEKIDIDNHFIVYCRMRQH